MVYRKDVRATIVDGPSKMDLLVALFYAYDQRRGPFFVTFYVQSDDLDQGRNIELLGVKGTPIKAKIVGISHEDGTGDSYIIKGYLDPYGCSKPDFSTKFEGYYSTKNRTGTLEFWINTADDK